MLGVLVVEPLTSQPESIFESGRRLVGGDARGQPLEPGRELHVEWAEPFQGGFRVQFAEIRDRDEADRWRDRRVLLARAELPEDPGDGIALEDLVGLEVVRENGDTVGTVLGYYELPHDVLIEVVRPGGDSVLIPFREEFVNVVDFDERRLVVEPPEGLL
jgi:16S rRNA processing protein RimM